MIGLNPLSLGSRRTLLVPRPDLAAIMRAADGGRGSNIVLVREERAGVERRNQTSWRKKSRAFLCAADSVM